MTFHENSYHEFFRRKVKGEGIEKSTLIEAVNPAVSGLIYSNLGEHIIKQRVKWKESTRGYRTLIVHKKGKIAINIKGFAKRSISNLKETELNALKEVNKIGGQI